MLFSSLDEITEKSSPVKCTNPQSIQARTWSSGKWIRCLRSPFILDGTKCLNSLQKRVAYRINTSLQRRCKLQYKVS